MLKPDQKQRIQYFFYKNSLKKAPKPVRVVTFPEKIPPLPLLNLTARAKKAEWAFRSFSERVETSFSPLN